MKQRGFSLYDIEKFLKEAGAERINENAVSCLEREIEETVKELVGEAKLYANYAGRKALIRHSDLELVRGSKTRHAAVYGTPRPRHQNKKTPGAPRIPRPTVDIIAVKQ